MSLFYVHRVLLRAALVSTLFFAWVFVFAHSAATSIDLAHAFGKTALLYSLAQVAVILATPLCGRAYAGGMVRVMLAGLLFLCAGFIALAAVFEGLLAAGIGLSIFAIASGLFRACYATPFALVRAMPPTRPLTEVVIALIPLAVGIGLSENLIGAQWLLYQGAAVVLASGIPLIFFEAYERYEWQYRESFGMLLEPAYRTLVRDSIARGFEAGAIIIVWPLFMFAAFGGAYYLLGIVVSIGTLAILLAQSLSIRTRAIRSPIAAAAIAGGSWVVRPYLPGLAAYAAVQVLGTSGDARRMRELILSDHFGDEGTFLDEVTVLKELSLGIGRLMCALLLAGATLTLPPFIALALVFTVTGLAAAIAAFHRARA